MAEADPPRSASLGLVAALGNRDERRALVPVLAALMLGLLLAELNQSVFATALPTVVGELHGAGQLLWVNTAYLLAGTVMMPVLGRLGDLFGRRRVFLAALSLLLAGSVVGGLATTMATLLTARVVQGLGGGGLLVLVQAVVADLVPARRRAPVMTLVGAVFALGAVLGPVLGGWLTDTAGWRWAFWLNVPVGALAVVTAFVWLPRDGRRSRHVGIDVPGIALLTTTVVSATLALAWALADHGLGSSEVLVAAAVAVLSGVGFLLVEPRAAHPLLPLGLFRRRSFVAAVLGGMVLAVAMFGTVGYLPTYLQMVTGLSPTRSGLVMLSLVAGLGTATVVAAAVVARTGRYRALPVIGAGIVAVALTLLATLEPGSALVAVGCYLFLLGAGIGCAWEVLVVVAQNAAPQSQVGVATGVNGFLREVGVLVGSAGVGAAFTGRLFDALPASPDDPSNPLTALTPAQLAALPADVQASVAAAYDAALTPVFAALVPIVVLGALLVLLIRPLPLATTLDEAGKPGDARARPTVRR